MLKVNCHSLKLFFGICTCHLRGEISSRKICILLLNFSHDPSTVTNGRQQEFFNIKCLSPKYIQGQKTCRWLDCSNTSLNKHYREGDKRHRNLGHLTDPLLFYMTQKKLEHNRFTTICQMKSSTLYCIDMPALCVKIWIHSYIFTF